MNTVFFSTLQYTLAKENNYPLFPTVTQWNEIISKYKIWSLLMKCFVFRTNVPKREVVCPSITMVW